MTSCPCGTGRDFALCCSPYIEGDQLPPTAEALMRSRYSAFTRGNLDYIGRTSTGEAAKAFDRKALARSLPLTKWLGLKILEAEAGGKADETGSVTFRVRFREGGREFVQTERSTFRRIDGAWHYEKGEVEVKTKPAATAPQVGRNDPCPCGSGKKYKKCCGAG